MDLCELVRPPWCRQSHRWGTEEVETERRVLDAFRAVHFFEQGHRPNMQAMPTAYLQQRRSLVHTAVQMADTLELPVGAGCVAGAQATHPQLLRAAAPLTYKVPGSSACCQSLLWAWLWMHCNQMQSCCNAAISCSSVSD